MNKDRILNSKDEMYDNCENTEQLFDNFYIPLLQKYNISQNIIKQLQEKLDKINEIVEKTNNKTTFGTIKKDIQKIINEEE